MRSSRRSPAARSWRSRGGGRRAPASRAADRLVGTEGGRRAQGPRGQRRADRRRAARDVLIGGKGTDKLRGGPGRDGFNMRDGVELAAPGQRQDLCPRRWQRRDQLRCRRRRRDRRRDRGRRLRLRGGAANRDRPTRRPFSTGSPRGELADAEEAERLESADREALLRRREFLAPHRGARRRRRDGGRAARRDAGRRGGESDARASRSRSRATCRSTPSSC